MVQKPVKGRVNGPPRQSPGPGAWGTSTMELPKLKHFLGQWFGSQTDFMCRTALAQDLPSAGSWVSTEISLFHRWSPSKFRGTKDCHIFFFASARIPPPPNVSIPPLLKVSSWWKMHGTGFCFSSTVHVRWETLDTFWLIVVEWLKSNLTSSLFCIVAPRSQLQEPLPFAGIEDFDWRRLGFGLGLSRGRRVWV